MDFRDSPQEALFRKKLQAWLERAAPDLPARRGRPDHDAHVAWSRRLYEAGYAGLTWPREYGGAGAPYTYQAILLEEMARARAPEHIGIIGLGMAGPTIIAHGTPAHKERWLARILSAEDVWCQGFSEPEAGSDLASVRTRAELAGDRYIVSGHKLWSSYAHVADWCLLLARSDPASSRYEGLTYLVVDMHAPGVEVRPLRQITGDAEFNEIFLDGVEVDRDSVLGPPGQGWKVAMTTLLHERGTLGLTLAARLKVAVANLLVLAREWGADAAVRDRIARLWIESQALRLTAYRSLAGAAGTGVPGPEGSVAKLVWSECNQRLTKLALEILGPYGVVDGADGPWSGYWQYQALRSRGNSIEAGTSEILRNIVAERVLGLPRSR